MTGTDPDEHTRHLAGESLAVNDPTGWFERLYVAAEEGQAVVPWDRGAPHRLLVQWAQERELHGDGQHALVIGCGLGEDAEYIAGLGFTTVAFDIAATAIRVARQRFPDSDVQYLTADLLDPPARWQKSFDLVVESLTVQSLPDSHRHDAIVQVGTWCDPAERSSSSRRLGARRSSLVRGRRGRWPVTRSQPSPATVFSRSGSKKSGTPNNPRCAGGERNSAARSTAGNLRLHRGCAATGAPRRAGRCGSAGRGCPDRKRL